MAKMFSFSINLRGHIEASTLEDAQQKLDNAIDFSMLRARGVQVRSSGADFTEEYNNCNEIGHLVPVRPTRKRTRKSR